MNCPHCQHTATRVVDSRETEGGLAVRRRRVCEACAQRFTTYERIEALVPVTLSPRTGQAVPRAGALARRRGNGARAAEGQATVTSFVGPAETTAVPVVPPAQA